MLRATSAAEQWPFEDELEIPASAQKAKAKPKGQKLHNAISRDTRLDLATYFLVSYRARRSAAWSCAERDLKREHGFGSKLFKSAMDKAKKFKYIERTQTKDAATGQWDFAKERYNSKAAPTNGRGGYLLVNEDDIAGLPWRQAALLTYLRSLPPSFISSAESIAKRFNVNEKTARTHLNRLVARGSLRLEEKRNARGQYELGGYVVVRAEAQKQPSGKKPTAGKPTAEKEPTSLGTDFSEKTNSTVFSLSERRKSITSSLEAMTRKPFSSEHEGEGRASTYKEKKAAKERRDIERLFKRIGIEPLFDMPKTLAEAQDYVTSVMQAKANDGVEIYDEEEGKHLVEVEFHDAVDDVAFGEPSRSPTSGFAKASSVQLEAG